MFKDVNPSSVSEQLSKVFPCHPPALADCWVAGEFLDGRDVTLLEAKLLSHVSSFAIIWVTVAAGRMRIRSFSTQAIL